MEQIAEKIREVIGRIVGVDFLNENLTGFVPEITLAPEGTDADYASNVAMKLFGRIKAGATELNLKDIPDLDADTIKSPRDLALLFSKIISEDEGFLFQVEVAGPGFLNFISKNEYFVQKLADFDHNFQKNISRDEYFNQQVICEFSDPNPFKVLHVGHLYTSIMGESISRLVETAGGKVVRANFGGDVGLHVAKTIYAMQKQGITPENLTDVKNIETIAHCYVDGTRAYEDDENAKKEIIKLNKIIYEIAAAGPEKEWNEAENSQEDAEKWNKAGQKEAVAKLYWRGRELSYQYFNDFYQRVGVKFDKYYPESNVAKRGLKEVESHVGTVYEKSNGAIIFPGEKFGLHTRVFINNEGLPTYETKDVGLIFTKWDDYHFDKSIVITGNDIIDYMKVVLCSVSQFAPELPARTKHITHGNVRLPGNEKMSSRKGNFIKAVDVLNDVTVQLKNDNSARDASVVSDDVLHQVTMAAIKYAFLKYKIGGNIEFDVKESVSMTGNSGVYLQYSGVRARKVLQAVTNAGDAEEILDSNWQLNGHEKSLIRKIDQYGEVLAEAVRELAPHKIANYLYELAQEFSRFYENVKVVGSEFEAERAQIVRAYFLTLEHGLNILGIEIPEEM